ncbi:hypothetical protein [Serratia marcescens]|uniref:hypothetical protein n=1 Tax=Serratia marcescens TaxID=615 RepID=UPI002765B48E|nr:hypothetical protein [Serratia marcescens]MDP8729005.1 hypothetical protein [Serratia marcescens]
MHRAKLITNLSVGLACFVVSFFIVLFPLGGVLDYLSQVSNNVLNETGLGFADGEADPSFLWVLLVLMLIVAAILFIAVRRFFPKVK